MKPKEKRSVTPVPTPTTATSSPANWAPDTHKASLLSILSAALFPCKSHVWSR